MAAMVVPPAARAVAFGSLLSLLLPAPAPLELADGEVDAPSQQVAPPQSPKEGGRDGRGRAPQDPAPEPEPGETERPRVALAWLAEASLPDAGRRPAPRAAQTNRIAFR